MNVDDIIEVVTVENRDVNVRRVRVKKVERRSRGFNVRAENLRGKYPRSYELPLEPLTSVNGLESGTHWLPFDNTGEIDP